MADQNVEAPFVAWSAASARRLERNGLAEPAIEGRPAEMARVMCGAHAQIMSAAELSIGLRIAGATQADIRAALWNEHSLVKTYGPRGTVHLLAADDLPMWAGALSATPYGQTRDPKNELLTREQHEEIIAAIAEVLADAELTTDELTEALADKVGAWAADPVKPAFQEMWPRWRAVQSTAGMRGALCFGLTRGRNVTFTNPRRWLPGFRPMDERPALAGLVRRYLYAYGPATPNQFAQWLAVSRRWAVELFDSLSNELQQVRLEGDLAWVAAGDTAFPADPPRGVCLLPYFDAYGIGCYPRERLFPGRAAERALTRGQAGNFPVLLVDGVVAGVWHQKKASRLIDITVEPLAELTPAQLHALDEQVERVGEVLAGKSQGKIGRVAVGPHA